MEDSKEVIQEIRTLSHQIKRLVDNSPLKQAIDDMTGTHGWIIGFIAANSQRNIYQRDIEQLFSIRRSTVSGILKLMEKNKLIIRESVEEDARLKKIVLTDKAQEVVRLFQQDHLETEKVLCEGISRQDLDIFLKVIEKMKMNINDNNRH